MPTVFQILSGRARPQGWLPAAIAAATLLLSAGLPANAQEKQTLTVYTYSGFPSEYGPGGVIKERFEAHAAAPSIG